MALYRVDGVVVGVKNVGEADKLLIVFSRNLGKVKLVAAGARHLKNKLVGCSQLFIHGNFIAFTGSQLDKVSQCTLKEHFNSLREDLDKLAYGSYIVELVDSLTEERQKNERIYYLLLKTLRILNSSNTRDLLLRIFELKLLDYLGYQPHLETCVVCLEHCGEKDKYAFSIAEGGLVCPNCFTRAKNLLHLSPQTVKLLRLFQDVDMDRIINLDIPENMLNELAWILQGLVKFHVGRELKSASFLSLIQHENRV